MPSEKKAPADRAEVHLTLVELQALIRLLDTAQISGSENMRLALALVDKLRDAGRALPPPSGGK